MKAQKSVSSVLSLLITTFLSLPQAYAQIPLVDVAGPAKIRGNIDLGHMDDTTTVLIGVGAGMNTDFSFQRGNTFVGSHAGQGNTSGKRNSFFGNAAGMSNIDGFNNSIFGHEAGFANTSGFNNSFFGHEAGFSNNSGFNNSFFGDRAGSINTSGQSNSFFGYKAGSSNSVGDRNSFFGNAAGMSNNTGSDNSFFGRDAGSSNISGSNNSFFGLEAGYLNTASSNSFFGYRSGSENISGTDNSFYGSYSGNNNNSGGYNSYYGSVAGMLNTDGVENSAFGYAAGFQKSTGNFSSFFGSSAGFNMLKGEGNTFLGYHSGIDPSVDSLDYAIAIGYLARVECNNCAVIGGTNTNAVKLGLGLKRPIQNLHIHEDAVSTQNILKITNAATGSTNFDGLDVGVHTDGSGRIYLQEDLDLAFGTNGLTRATIKNTGAVGIGISTPVQHVHIHESQASTSNFLRLTNNTSGSTSSDGLDLGIESNGDAILWMKENKNLKFATNNSVRLMLLNNGNLGIGENNPNVALDVNGSIEYTGDLTKVSDMRLKENIEKIPHALDKILGLNGFTYNLIGEDERTSGVSAQEVQKILPEAVGQINEEYLGVDYIQLTPLLIEAIKELNQIVMQQKEEIKALKRAQLHPLKRSTIE